MISSSVLRFCCGNLLIFFSSSVLYAAPATPDDTSSVATKPTVTPAFSDAATAKPAVTPAYSDAVPKSPKPPVLKPIGIVIWTKGLIKAGQPDKSARTLSRRSPIYSHDVITTDATGTGEIAFTDSSVFSLMVGSQLKIDEYNFKKDAPPAQDKSVMSIVKGGFRTITGSIPKQNPDGYKVNTPVATIGVRGTQYSVAVSAKRGAVFKIDKGIIQVANKAGKIDIQKCDVNATNCIKFANVTGLDSAPVALDKMPDEFIGEPPISPALVKDIESIGQAGSSSSGGGSSKSGGSSSSGSFCVQ